MNIINTFLFYSIIGHFLENIIYTKIDSGILYGYWTPIYGLGVLLISLIFYLICKYVKNKLYRAIDLFFISALSLGTLEFLGGILIEKIFGRVFWDYSDQFLHIGKYTSIKMMTIWGFSSVLFIYLIHPFMKLIIKKIPKSLTITLAFLFVIDLIFTLFMLTN